MKDSDAQFSPEKTNINDPLTSSCFEKVITINKHQTNGLRLKNHDMSQTICLFRKYLLTKNQPTIGKTNMPKESQFTERTSLSGHPPPLIPPKFRCNLTRRPSFLEQELLPVMRRDVAQSALSDERSQPTQLTIFYAGVVNVYENVSADKAHAIMHLAGESSLSKPPVSIEMTKSERRTSPSICNLQAADIPMARSHSLHRFLEKRRKRVLNKSPYAPSGTKHKDVGQMQALDDHDIKEKHSIALSPFPSRLGYFFPCNSSK